MGFIRSIPTIRCVMILQTVGRNPVLHAARLALLSMTLPLPSSALGLRSGALALRSSATAFPSRAFPIALEGNGISLADIAVVVERNGCKLFCCWCAQDLAANRFWEAMGFVPLAYRAGSEKKRRVHIFWQKRIRQDDATTPWWFPAKTDAGAMRADRIVLPIPVGVHWSDEMPMILLPAEQPAETQDTAKLAIAEGRSVKKSRALDMTPPPANGPAKRAARQFDAPPAKAVVVEPVVAAVVETVVEKPKRAKKPKAKADPKMIAAARELRDRWLEHVNAGEMLLEGAGKYDVSKTLSAVDRPAMPERPTLLLPAA
jgi:hypothetical protein